MSEGKRRIQLTETATEILGDLEDFMEIEHPSIVEAALYQYQCALSGVGPDEEEAETDPMLDLVHANIDSIRNVCEEGLHRASRHLRGDQQALAMETIQAALSFHPMHAEDWPGWPETEGSGSGK